MCDCGNNAIVELKCRHDDPSLQSDASLLNIVQNTQVINKAADALLDTELSSKVGYETAISKSNSSNIYNISANPTSKILDLYSHKKAA